MQSISKSKVFIFPNAIANQQIDFLNITYYEKYLQEVTIFFVENAKPARQFLKLINKAIDINKYEWIDLKHHENDAISAFKNALQKHETIGIISDAGCPCIADPGSDFVFIAQQYQASIHALVGPCSLILALMCSGLNGQQFSFHGYLPIKDADKIKTLKEIERQSKANGYTQIFIETPFRNQHLFQSILENGNASTQLCIATNLSAPTQFVITKTIKEWQSQNFILEKMPSLFLLLA